MFFTEVDKRIVSFKSHKGDIEMSKILVLPTKKSSYEKRDETGSVYSQTLSRRFNFTKLKLKLKSSPELLIVRRKQIDTAFL